MWGGSKPKYQGEKYRLTRKEQEFAEKNHALIFGFLRMKRIPVEEYYDVAAVGYIIAVIKYNREPRLQKYRFSSICYKTMACEVNNEQNRQRKDRDHVVFSLDENNDDTGCHDRTPDPKDYFGWMEYQEDMRELLTRIMPALSDRQREFLVMMLEGYRYQEITKKLKLTFEKYSRDKEAVKKAVLSVLDVPGTELPGNQSCTGATGAG